MAIDFRKNANVLTWLHGFAKPKQRTTADPYVVDGYELHAHPDLVVRLKDLMGCVAEARMEFAYGVPILFTPKGRGFASAGGTASLYLYLPEEETWGAPYPEYGEPWRRGSAWLIRGQHTPEDEEHFASLLRLAFSTAMKFDSEEG